jgi:hypothetical protein
MGEKMVLKITIKEGQREKRSLERYSRENAKNQFGNHPIEKSKSFNEIEIKTRHGPTKF